jgi:hypothetical protein
MATGKRLRKAYEGINRDAFYAINDAVKIIKSNATAKFDETIEISLNLGIDPRHADQNVRGVVQLPHGTGKSLRVAVFAKGDKAKIAKDAGADIVGAEDLAEKVNAGQIEFDRVIATPDMMALVGRLGKVLGPRGLMPNEARYRHQRRRRGGQGDQGRPGRVPRREVGADPRRYRQGQLQRGGDRRQREGVRGRDQPRQAGRCEGHLPQEGLHQLDHGSGREARRGDGRRLSFFGSSGRPFAGGPSSRI